MYYLNNEGCRVAIESEEIEKIRQDVKASLCSPTKFLSWLSGKENDEVIGIPRDSQWCPIFKYLSEYHNPFIYQVGMDSVYFTIIKDDHRVSECMPLWVISIIRTIDKQFVKGAINKRNSIVNTHILLRRKDLEPLTREILRNKIDGIIPQGSNS